MHIYIHIYIEIYLYIHNLYIKEKKSIIRKRILLKIKYFKDKNKKQKKMKNNAIIIKVLSFKVKM